MEQDYGDLVEQARVLVERARANAQLFSDLQRRVQVALDRGLDV